MRVEPGRVLRERNLLLDVDDSEFVHQRNLYLDARMRGPAIELLGSRAGSVQQAAGLCVGDHRRGRGGQLPRHRNAVYERHAVREQSRMPGQRSVRGSARDLSAVHEPDHLRHAERMRVDPCVLGDASRLRHGHAAERMRNDCRMRMAVARGPSLPTARPSPSPRAQPHPLPSNRPPNRPPRCRTHSSAPQPASPASPRRPARASSCRPRCS